MEQKVKELVEKIFAQAENGYIKIDSNDKNIYYDFYVKFFANIEGKCSTSGYEYSVLEIPNYNLFIEKVKSYLEVAKDFYKRDKSFFDLEGDSFYEKLFFSLLVNTSLYDQVNIYDYIDKRTQMLKTDFPSEKFSLGKYGAYKLVCQIEKNNSNLEAPYNFKMSFEDEMCDHFDLPVINFAFYEKSCYIFSIQNETYKQKSPVSKRLDRYFRKLNSGVDMEDLIANVSPNALVSLTLFGSFLKQNGIEEIIAPDFMPLRYTTNLEARTRGVSDNDTYEKIDRDQFNITNKFMYLFLRYNHHFPDSVADYDIDRGEMHLSLKGKEKLDENIIYELDEMVDLKQYSEKSAKGREKIF